MTEKGYNNKGEADLPNQTLRGIFTVISGMCIQAVFNQYHS